MASYYTVGLDPSLCNMGYCVLGGEGKVVDKGTIKTKTTGLARLELLCDLCNSIASKWGVRTIYREDYAFAKHSGSDTQLKELGGALLYSLMLKGVATQYLPISTIKKFATGKGNAPKAHMLKEVFRRFSVDAEDEHQADAFAVAALALEYSKPGTFKGLTKPQKDAALKCQPRAFT